MRKVFVTMGIAATTLTAHHPAGAAPNSFGSDLQFLRRHTDVVVLSGRGGAAVTVSPRYQGRVLTSTASGPQGMSLGWINRSAIASGKLQPHINVFGGEDRFWLGPEGGQFSIFFKKGAAFDLAHWQTPPAIDSEPFQVVSRRRDRVHLRKKMRLVNYSNTPFNLEVNREVRLLPAAQTWKTLKIAPMPRVKMVAYESDNRVTNTGKAAWNKKSGLLSVWILGMFPPSPSTTIVIPFKPGPVSKMGPVVNDAYFGKVPANRLKVKDRVLFFSADGRYRSKIGLPPGRALPIMGSYDAAHKVLTLVQYTRPPSARDYVNSMWKIQDKPYGGDVANSYNDGPPAPGKKPLGPFYELESSSPAAALKPRQSITHIHRTMHFQGAERDLDRIARAALGVSLSQIKAAFA